MATKKLPTAEEKKAANLARRKARADADFAALENAAKAAKEKKTKKAAKKAAEPKPDKAAAKEAAAADKKVVQEKTRRELEPFAREINVRLEKAATMDDKANDHRLAAAITLAEARQKCEVAGISFKEWSAVAVPTQSYETVRKLVGVGASDNPAKALEDLRSKNALANKELRERKAKAITHQKEPAGTQPKAATPFKRAEEAFAALDDSTQLEMVKSRAKNLGMRVVSEGEAKATKSAKAGDEYDTAKDAFNALKASEKMSFLQWAASEVGGKFSTSFDNGNGNEMPEIPAGLDKRGPRRKAPKDTAATA